MEETALAGRMSYGETVPLKQEVNTNNYLWVDLDKFDRTVRISSLSTPDQHLNPLIEMMPRIRHHLQIAT